MRTYTIYLVSKFGIGVMQVHLCQHFRDSSFFVLYARITLVASSPTHPSPTAPAPWSTTVGLSGRGRWGWNSPSCQSPSKQTRAKAPCVYKQFNWIWLNVYSGLIWAKPNTPWAIKGNGWAIGTLSFSAMQTHLLRSTTSSCTNQNQAARRENKHHAVRLLRNLENRTSHITRIGPEVYKTPTRPTPADSVVIRATSDRVNAGKDFF